VKPPFEILEHPSDLGIEAHGTSLKEVFRNAACGMMFVIAGSSVIEKRQQRSVFISATDREKLLVKWLAEVLFLYDAQQFLFSDVNFEILNDTTLNAWVLGEQYDSLRHYLKMDMKAVTYHQLSIENHGNNWTARVFVDI
jgi:SHS2 domain-containing protein